jgi:hypothetical protein
MSSIIKSDIKKKKKTLSKKPVKGTIKKRAKKHVNKPVKKPTKKFVKTQKLMIGDYRGYSQKDFINNLYRQPNISRFGTVVDKLYTPLYISPGALSTLNVAPMDNKPFNQTTDAWTENYPELSILKYDKTNKTQQSLIPQSERVPPIPFEKELSEEELSEELDAIVLFEADPAAEGQLVVGGEEPATEEHVVEGDFEELEPQQIIMNKLAGLPFTSIKKYVKGLLPDKELGGPGAVERGKEMIVKYILGLPDTSLQDKLIAGLGALRKDWTEERETQTKMDIELGKQLKAHYDKLSAKNKGRMKEFFDYLNTTTTSELRGIFSDLADENLVEILSSVDDNSFVTTIKELIMGQSNFNILYKHFKNKQKSGTRGRSPSVQSETKRRVSSSQSGAKERSRSKSEPRLEKVKTTKSESKTAKVKSKGSKRKVENV